MKIILLFLLISINGFLVSAQGWDRRYDGGFITKTVVASDDGGFAVVGSGSFMKIDSSGKVLWSIKDEVNYSSLFKTSDHHYLIAGNTWQNNGPKGVILKKISDSGKVVFSKVYNVDLKAKTTHISEIDESVLITRSCS